MRDHISRGEIRKDALQDSVETTATAVGTVATIVTTAVRDVARALGGLATDLFEIRESVRRARDDHEPDEPVEGSDRPGLTSHPGPPAPGGRSLKWPRDPLTSRSTVISGRCTHRPRRGHVQDFMLPPDPRTTLASRPPASSPERPRLGTVIRRVSLSLLIACVIPAALFYVCVVAAGVWVAIFAALAWSYGAIVWRLVTRRRTSGLLILTAIVMTGRTGVAMLTDSTFLYFLQPIISDGAVATTFLLSLVSARPMVARLAGDFYPMDHELAMRPRIRRLFRRLTVLWAVLCVSKAVMTLWLLQSQSVETFVLVKGIGVLLLNAVAVAVTIAAAVVVARKEGLLGPPLVPALVPGR